MRDHRALLAGQEPFDTTAGGPPVVEHPDAGEVVWRDDAGVTCRRCNGPDVHVSQRLLSHP